MHQIILCCTIRCLAFTLMEVFLEHNRGNVAFSLHGAMLYMCCSVVHISFNIWFLKV